LRGDDDGHAQATREEAQTDEGDQEQQEGPSLGDDEDEQDLSQASEEETVEKDQAEGVRG
jgi:hypothetical protein